MHHCAALAKRARVLVRRNVWNNSQLLQVGVVHACREYDVLAVYGALEDDANGGVVMIPPASFQRFCFGKARYMRQLRVCGVPIAPTLFIDRGTVIAG
eukprot:COSAG02_NODE_26131_length_640_cov_0.746765_2_plen_97_part_01